MPTYRPPSPATCAWLAAVIGGEVVQADPLVGGITADVDRVVVRRASGREAAFVLRRWTATADWTHGLVEREAAALTALAPVADVPTPELVAADPTGDDAGVRCLLMTELPGEPTLAPTDLSLWLSRLAATQARIHAVAARLPVVEPHIDPPRTSWIPDEGLRRVAVSAASASRTDLGLVHGDYQPFNVLWRDGVITGVVDWPNACTASQGDDVGHCVLNVAVLFSPDAAVRYLSSYEAAAGRDVDTGAVLRALLAWDPEWMSFIPQQVAGRAPLDVAGMPQRVVDTVRRVADRLG